MAGDIMTPLEAIERDPSNVWLTSFYGFAPRNWGFLTLRFRYVRRAWFFCIGGWKRKSHLTLSLY